MDQPLKSPLLAADMGSRFACWGVVICIFILTMPSTLEPVPLNHWRLVTLIGIEITCISIMWQFRRVAVARDIIDLQLFEAGFFALLLGLYFFHAGAYVKLSVGYAKPFLIWVFMTQLLRLFWIIPNPLGSAYMEWPRFGPLGWFYRRDPGLPLPGPGAKLAVLFCVIAMALLANWLSGSKLPWSSWLMPVSGLVVIAIYARSINNRVSQTIDQNLKTLSQIMFYQRMMNEAADYIEQL
ncbi:MAG: hypothetical protein RL748_1609, partial [Pseudomonadota bacterium]